MFGRVRARADSTQSDRADGFALFGGVERRALSRTFREADLTAPFGAATLDLRDVGRSPDDDPVRVDATALFGAVEIVAPREWNVRLEALPIFGAAGDSRMRTERSHETVDLVVDGFVASGAVEVED